MECLKVYTYTLPSEYPSFSLAWTFSEGNVTLAQGDSLTNFEPFFYLLRVSQTDLAIFENLLNDSFPFHFFLWFILPNTILLRKS